MLTKQTFCKTGHTMMLIILLAILLALAGRSNQPALAQASPSLLFVENIGQFDSPARFQTSSAWGNLWLAEDALWFTLTGSNTESDPNSSEPQQGVHLKLSFVGANPQPELEPFDPLDVPVSYLSANNPADEYAAVPVWGGVRYVDLYPGIDLEITSENGQLVQRLVVRDSTAQDAERLSNIQLQVEGAETLAVTDGQLRLNTSAGEFTLPLFQLEQMGTQIASTNLNPTVEANVVTQPFTFEAVADTTPVQIAGTSDLVYSTFLGGSVGGEYGKAIAVDPAGNAYIAGNTSSPDFPTTPGAFNTDHEGQDGFVVKLNTDGSALVYAAFLENARAFGIAVDDAGSAYVTGDNTVVRLNTTGTALLYATSIEGGGQSIAIDEAGNAYVTGSTTSTTFATTPGAFQPNFQGGGWFGQDAFVVKLNPTGEVAYVTYLGGSDDDAGEAIAVDAEGSAYVTGRTESANFPSTPDAFKTSQDTIFVVKLNPAGSALTYGTFLGGNGNDDSHAIAVDQTGNAYVVGDTTSSNFPVTPGAFQTTYHVGFDLLYEGDVFVVKLNPTGTGLVYGTYLGGSDHDNGWGLAVDQAGNAYVSGSAYSPDFPTTPDSFQPTRSGYPDVFVAKLNTAGSDLIYGTYLGGDYGESGYALTADETGLAYITGYTSSPNFPITAGAFDNSRSSGDDVFVSKLFTGDTPVEPEPTPTPPIPAYDCAPTTLGTVTVGDTPRGIALDVAKQRAYVANYGSGSVAVIDTDTNTVFNTIANVPAANGIAYDELHNMIWVTNTDYDQVTPIQVDNTATSFTVLDPITVGAGPWGVVFNSFDGLLYVTNSLSDTVSVVDPSQQSVITTLTGNFSQPYHLAANPTNGKVYVANFGNNTVTVLKEAAIEKVVNLYDSTQPYGITVDETRNVVYVSTVNTNRIVAIGTLNGVPDQFLGWSMFFRGYNRHRPLPMRVIAVNPDVGPSYDGGHLWTTTATVDGSEFNQALLIPKGWSSYFHVPLPQSVSANPTDGLAVDRINDRVYISSGVSPGIVTVIGDHDNQCPGVAPAAIGEETADFSFNTFSREALLQGDATNDGIINIFDLAFIASRYNSSNYRADVNDDGVVDIFDLAFIASHYEQKVR